MILPLVSELLMRVARRPVVEETFEALRRGGAVTSGRPHRSGESASRAAGLRGIGPGYGVAG